jgi:hypothetical protein
MCSGCGADSLRRQDSPRLCNSYSMRVLGVLGGHGGPQPQGGGGRRLKGRKRRKQVAGGRDGGLAAAWRRGGRDGTEAATKGRASSVVWSVLGTQILEIFVVFSSLDG